MHDMMNTDDVIQLKVKHLVFVVPIFLCNKIHLPKKLPGEMAEMTWNDVNWNVVE